MQRSSSVALFCLLLFSYTFTCYGQVSIKPNNISGLQLWLRADSLSTVQTSGQNVTQWNDCSGNSFNVSQGNSGMQPTLQNNVLNGRPVIRFDGNTEYLTGGNILNMRTKSWDIYVIASSNNNDGALVTKSDNASNNIYYLGYFGGSLYWGFYANNITTHLSAGKYFIYNAKTSRSILENELFINNDSLSSSSITNTDYNCPTCNFDVGYADATFDHFNGDIAEIIIYDTILSPTQKIQLEYYFRYKYAPPVNLGADITIPYGFCDTTLDAGAGFNTYHWSNGASTRTITVNQGTYSVTATDTVFGFTSSDTIKVTYAAAANLPDTTYFCNGDSALLSSGLGKAYTYQWNSGQTTDSIYVKTAGKYWVTVTDTTAAHCWKVSDTTLVLKDTFALMASLGPATVTICSGNSIELVQPSPLPAGLTYLWTGGITTPSLVITNPGKYFVTVTDKHGCVAVDSVMVTISGNAPTPGFSDIRACSGQLTQFTDTSFGTPNNWLWHFGDPASGSNDSSALSTPTHKYLMGGYYHDTLTVGNNGCKSTIVKVIHIPQSPVAAFAVNTACIGNAYSFVDESTASEGHIIKWLWHFDDPISGINDTASAQNPQHTYTSPGIYSDTLSVQTDSGCTAEAVHQITVVGSAPAPSGFTLYLPNDSMVTTDQTINFAWNNAINAVSYTLEYSPDPLFISSVTAVPNIAITSAQQNISVPQTYYWRVVAYNICGNSSISDIYNFTIFSSNTIPGLQLWLKADSVPVHISGSNIAQWYDCSGNSYSIIQSNTAMQPTVQNNVINGRPVIRFDGSNDYLTGGNILNMGTNSWDIYVIGRSTNNDGAIVTKYDNASDNIYGLGYYNSSLYWSFYAKNIVTNLAAGKFYYYNAKSSRSILQNELFVNNNSEGATSISSANRDCPTCNFDIGYADAVFDHFNGDIAEIIIYNTILNPAQKTQLESYLQSKYAPPVNLGPDIWSTNFCDTTLNAGPNFVHYKWNTGNIGDTLSTLVVDTAGAYSVTATDIFGFTSSDSIFVHKPTITAHDTTACVGSNVTLHTGLSSPFTFSWNGGVSIADTFVANVPSTDSVTIFDTYGCHVTKIIQVLADSFAVKAKLGPSTICTGDSIYLATGAGSAISYDWNDGINQSFGTYYPVNWLPGTHNTLWLTVTDANGCAAKFNTNITVAGYKPDVGFKSDSGCAPLHARFTDTTNNPEHSFWNFGNGYTGSGTTPVQVYTNSGTYQVTLTDTTIEGCFASVTKPAYVYSIPVSNFIPLIGCEGVPLQFKDKSTNLFGNIVGWRWNFGDTGSGAADLFLLLQDPSHTYHLVSTTDVVELIVTSKYGCKDTVFKTITIRDAPDVGFKYTSVCEGNPVYFNDTTVTQPWNAIIDWNWNMDNGVYTSTIQNPVYTFSGEGIYPVSLTVRSLNGCIVTDTENVLVNAIPEAAFVPNSACMDAPYTFVDSRKFRLLTALHNGNGISEA